MKRIAAVVMVLIALIILSVASLVIWEFLKINSYIDRCDDDTSRDYIWDAAARARLCDKPVS